MHSCHAINCKTEIEPKLFMCYKHWKTLPKKLQIAIWQAYRPGQEIDKSPSFKYLSVQQYAIAEIASREGFQLEADRAYANSAKYKLLDDKVNKNEEDINS